MWETTNEKFAQIFDVGRYAGEVVTASNGIVVVHALGFNFCVVLPHRSLLRIIALLALRIATATVTATH